MLWQRLPEPSYTATLAVRSKASGLFCLGYFFFPSPPCFFQAPESGKHSGQPGNCVLSLAQKNIILMRIERPDCPGAPARLQRIQDLPSGFEIHP